MGLRKWISGIVRKVLEEDSKKSSGVFLNSNSNSGLDDTYLFDFKNYGSAYSGGLNGSSVFVNASMPSFPPNSDVSYEGGEIQIRDANVSAKTPKVRLTPKGVLNELETVPTPFDLTNLDDRISVLKDKEKLITQSYAKREMTHLIQRIENRKKYAEHKEFFDRFQNTTDEKIDALLKKHDHLVEKTSDLFIPEFPNEAIEVMKAYTEKVALICDKKPVFYVIAEADKFKEAFKKRDPILLVQSPFGFYWQILGAWDEEMLLLSEL